MIDDTVPPCIKYIICPCNTFLHIATTDSFSMLSFRRPQFLLESYGKGSMVVGSRVGI
jgi:hypothetical protein